MQSKDFVSLEQIFKYCNKHREQYLKTKNLRKIKKIDKLLKKIKENEKNARRTKKIETTN